jgi:putative cardiolipin synthase
VLALGPIVAEVSRVFEVYWNSESAVPLTRLVPAATLESGRRLMQSAKELDASENAQRYRTAVRATPLVQDLLAGRLTLEWAEARLVSDPPSKVLADSRTDYAPVLDRLLQVLGTARHEVDIVSPYFVPTRNGVDALRTLAARGVRIRILTNSLAATDVAAVHAGYAKYRKPLLDAGIALFELKPTFAGTTAGKRGARGGSSGASLHAKTFAVDRCRAYVGSFNFDPRSARLNTEMGVVMESPAVATRISETLDRDLPFAAYEVRATEVGGLQWITRDTTGEQRFESEPGASVARRIGVRVLSILPIEGFL